MPSKELHFQHDGHVTKRTFRFAELAENGDVLPKVEAPEGLTVKIEW